MKSFLERAGFYIKRKLIPIGYHLMKEPNPEKWVFIVGCYNSGTTLFHDTLALHPEIGSMPNEGQFFSNVLPTGRQFGLPRLWAVRPELFHITENNGDRYSASKLKRQWALFYNNPRKKVLVEKTILNSARMRWLQKNFPNSYFIAIVRNGYAVAEGIRRKEKHPLEKAIQQWKVSNEIMLQDLEFIHHKLLITYEDFTADPSKTLETICSFLEIQKLDIDLTGKEFTVHKFTAAVENQNQKSIDSLTEEEIELMNSIAGDLLKKFNYYIS